MDHCPICKSKVVQVTSGLWRCPQNKYHYYQWRAAQLRKLQPAWRAAHPILTAFEPTARAAWLDAHQLTYAAQA